jgi:hypothetical protein
MLLVDAYLIEGQALATKKGLGDFLETRRATFLTIWYLSRHEKTLLGFYTGSITEENSTIVAKIRHLTQNTSQTEPSITKIPVRVNERIEYPSKFNKAICT